MDLNKNTKIKKINFNENKGTTVYKIIMLILLTALISSIITIVVLKNYNTNTEYVYWGSSNNSSNSTLDSYLSKFKQMIDNYYLGEEVSENDLMTGAIKGYISALNDPYTEYFTKEEMDQFTETTSRKLYWYWSIYS